MLWPVSHRATWLTSQSSQQKFRQSSSVDSLCDYSAKKVKLFLNQAAPNIMRKLILIRHSAVTQDPTLSSHEWSLSAVGRTRAQALAASIAPHNPTRFITSEEAKAHETGQIIAAALGKPWTTAPGLPEHNREGTPYFPSQAEFEAAVMRLFEQPRELVFGQETAEQACHRFTQTVHTLLAQYPTDTLAVVSHGTVLTLFLAHHNPHLDPVPFWRSLALPSFVVVSIPTMEIIP
jgi:broad specificity phosphatase PhoE